MLFWLTDSWGNFFQWHSLSSWPGIQSDNKALVNCPEPFHENMRVHTGQVLYLVLNQASHSSRSEPMNCKRILKLLFLQWKNSTVTVRLHEDERAKLAVHVVRQATNIMWKKHCFVGARRHGEEAAPLSVIWDGTWLRSLFSLTPAAVHAVESISAPLSAGRAHRLEYDSRLGLLKLARRFRWDAFLVLDASFGSRRRWTGFNQREGDSRTATTPGGQLWKGLKGKDQTGPSRGWSCTC